MGCISLHLRLFRVLLAISYKSVADSQRAQCRGPAATAECKQLLWVKVSRALEASHLILNRSILGAELERVGPILSAGLRELFFGAGETSTPLILQYPISGFWLAGCVLSDSRLPPLTFPFQFAPQASSSSCRALFPHDHLDAFVVCVCPASS